ncbi:hypothetical protein N7522_005259 [Penicillium canescens]|nr:hypothetical protein N7522_005259 [Penicillium canescens]
MGHEAPFDRGSSAHICTRSETARSRDSRNSMHEVVVSSGLHYSYLELLVCESSSNRQTCRAAANNHVVEGGIASISNVELVGQGVGQAKVDEHEVAMNPMNEGMAK